MVSPFVVLTVVSVLLAAISRWSSAIRKSTIGTSQAAYTIALLKEMDIELPKEDIRIDLRYALHLRRPD